MKLKTIIIILGVILVVFMLVQVYFYFKIQRGIETYPYKIISTLDDLEIRNYEAALFTSVKLTTKDYKQASRKGFSKLAGYIFGGNNQNKKIAMTAPVAISLTDSMEMMFMVPKKYSLQDLPKPNEKDITFKKIPAKTVAAITFGGYANNKKIERYKAKLIATLNANNIKYTKTFYVLGYNAPFELLKRKNEVIVELKE